MIISSAICEIRYKCGKGSESIKIASEKLASRMNSLFTSENGAWKIMFALEFIIEVQLNGKIVNYDSN